MNSAERRAAWWYRLRGWRILGANVWAGGNEVDLIARRGRSLRFVEVKEKRGTAFGDPAEMVGPRNSGVCAAQRRRGWRRIRSSTVSTSGSTSSRCGRGGFSAWPTRSRKRVGSPTSEVRPLMAVTQDELYATLDLELSWSEQALPEHVRTKHVHRLHPYHGKFIPQLVEVLLDRYFTRGAHVLDPFAGSGTTLVQALESGLDATGVELAAFNCLLMRVKTAHYDVEALGEELRDACGRLDTLSTGKRPRKYMQAWYSPAAAGELLAFRDLIGGYEHADVLRIILSRAARSARRAAHFDLEAPRQPQTGEYWCHKHRRMCKPVESAVGFLRRYTLDALARIEAFAEVRDDERSAHVLHADSRTVEYETTFDGVVTSPPYPGLIDYHEQHRYAYELLGLDDRRELELGAAAEGTSRAALDAYCDGVAQALANAADALAPDSPLLIVVNDRRSLYPKILDRAGLQLENRLRRHVNRRTGRRAGEYFEDVLVAKPR